MNIKIYSPGCRLNQAEIESVSTSLKNNGHNLNKSSQADVFIINSCCVTLNSERTVRQLINRAQRSNPKARIILTGCATEQLQKDNRVEYLSNDYKYLIPELLENRINIDEIQKETPSRFNYDIPLKCSTKRVNLKIQDGCDNFCTYCIIPYLRGDLKSKPLHQAKKELIELVNAGFREIVLSGVNIGKYKDSSADLADLVNELTGVEGNFRLHLTSIAPDRVSDKLISLFNNSKLVKHLHLSLQSGSNQILKSMNRSYSREDYIRVVDKVRSLIPDFNFTTDIITGFPGETELDHMDTIDLVKKSGFSHIHTFRFTPRPGTAAERYSGTVAESVKKKRSEDIREINLRQKETYYSKFDGKESIFLCESVTAINSKGFNEFYIPISVNERIRNNRFFKVITKYSDETKMLSGEIIEEI